jgi:hypothetical protein
MERVIAYVDGFNFYFGLKASKWERYLWLNYQQLVNNLLRPNQQLVFMKYFTTRISAPLDKRKRQTDYIEALETLPDFRIYYGKYQMNPRHCRKCGFRDLVPNEKMTDVNIATELIVDAFQDRFDTALLISADSDLIGPVVSVRKLFPMKRLVIAFPPQRYSEELKKVASAYFTVGRAEIAKSLFPLKVVKADGYVLQCPATWQ